MPEPCDLEAVFMIITLLTTESLTLLSAFPSCIALLEDANNLFGRIPQLDH